MNGIQSEIQKEASKYFDAKAVHTFLDRISKWLPGAQATFFQVTQNNDEPQLEFGVLVGSALVDLTMNIQSICQTTIPINNLSLSVFEEDETQNRVLLFSHSGHSIIYTAASDLSRVRLRDFAESIDQFAIRGRL